MFIVVAFIVIYRSIKLLKVLPGLAILVITGGFKLTWGTVTVPATTYCEWFKLIDGRTACQYYYQLMGGQFNSSCWQQAVDIKFPDGDHLL